MHRGVTGDRLSNHHLEMRVIEERSPGSFSGSEADEGSRLVPDAATAAGYLSDDGTTPLVAKVRHQLSKACVTLAPLFCLLQP